MLAGKSSLISEKSGNLVKARLTSEDGVPPIEFMFNPTELSFNRDVKTSENPGARTKDEGLPKVSYSYIKAYTVTIKKILFDTYEDGSDVVSKYIEPFRTAVKFVGGKERPPIYTFSWGDQVYLRRCFVVSLTYNLTMFLPDGTPVRAVIDSLTLKEVDKPEPGAPVAAKNPTQKQRQQQSMDNMKKKPRK